MSEAVICDSCGKVMPKEKGSNMCYSILNFGNSAYNSSNHEYHYCNECAAVMAEVIKRFNAQAPVMRKASVVDAGKTAEQALSAESTEVRDGNR